MKGLGVSSTPSSLSIKFLASIILIFIEYLVFYILIIIRFFYNNNNNKKIIFTIFYNNFIENIV
jgi:hypothetical protein